MRSPGCHRDEHHRTGTRSEEWGFTLPELLATIAIIGIIAAIAIPSFFGIIEERRVQSATNQLASDLRLAHSRSVNELETVQIKTSATGYQIATGSPITPAGPSESKTLPSSTRISPTGFMVDFCPNGSVYTGDAVLNCASTYRTSSYVNLTVASGSGSPAYRIKVNTQSSNVEVCATTVADNSPCPATS